MDTDTLKLAESTHVSHCDAGSMMHK